MLDKTVTLRLDTQTYEDLVNLAATKQQETNNVYGMADVMRELISSATKNPLNEKKTFISTQSYNRISRKILMEDVLSKKAIPKYIKEAEYISYTIPKRGQLPMLITGEEEIIVPLFRIACNPSWDIEDERDCDYIVNRAILRGTDSINRQEDTELFNLLKNASTTYPQDSSYQHTIFTEEINYDDFLNACNKIKENDLFVNSIIVNPNKYSIVCKLLKEFNENTKNDKDIEILEHNMCPVNTVYFVAPSEYVGVIPIKTDLGILDNPNPISFKNGKVLYRTLGMAIINDKAISKIVIGNEVPEIDIVAKQEKEQIIAEMEAVGYNF